LYNFAKYIINSLYGKFGQDPQKNSTTSFYINEAYELRKLIINQHIEISNFEMITDHTALCTTKRINPELTTHSMSNAIISSFVSSYARIYLHKQLMKSDLNTLYFDTDSIISIQNDRDTKAVLPKIGKGKILKLVL